MYNEYCILTASAPDAVVSMLVIKAAVAEVLQNYSGLSLIVIPPKTMPLVL